MDPNVILERLRQWAAGEDAGMDTGDAMEAFADLDEWLTRGGFLPDGWRHDA